MKEIVKISIPKTRLRGRIKQANGYKFSRRVVFPANVPKFGSHILLISEDFIKPDLKDPEKCTLHFYAENEVSLSKRVVLADGEVVYPIVKTTPKELKDAVAEKIPQIEKEQKFDKDTIENLKKNISAVEYLSDVYGFTFQRTGHRYFKCDQHDSLVVDLKNNAIYWNSQHIQGSLIDFIVGVDKKSVGKAIEDLNTYYQGLPQDKKILTLPEFEEKEFSLPIKATTNANVKKYLCDKRGIDEIIVNKLIQENRIYQDVRGNCVFVMENSVGDAVGAFKRSTYSGFRGDAGGSKKEYGFYYEACPNAKKLVITESFIDALSYITLKQMHNEPIDFNILGSDSATTLNETFRINYLARPELHKNIDTIIVAPDNDKAGKLVIDNFKEFVKPFHYIASIQTDVPETKDWNEDLQVEREQEMSLQL